MLALIVDQGLGTVLETAPEAERTATLARVAGIVRAGETPAELPVHVTLGLATPA